MAPRKQDAFSKGAPDKFNPSEPSKGQSTTHYRALGASRAQYDGGMTEREGGSHRNCDPTQKKSSQYSLTRAPVTPGNVNKKWQSWRTNAELSGVGPPVKYVPPTITPQYFGPLGTQPEVSTRATPHRERLKKHNSHTTRTQGFPNKAISEFIQSEKDAKTTSKAADPPSNSCKRSLVTQ